MKKLITLLLIAFSLSAISQSNTVYTPNIRPLEIDNFFLKISSGQIPGMTSNFKFSRSVTISSTESVIWDGGGTYLFLDSAQRLKIVSDDANDSLGGSGAHIVLISGLDTAKRELTELVIMDGLDTVLTTNAFRRTNRMIVITSGTNDPVVDANIGDITASTETDIILQAKMLATNGQTLMSPYTVPRGKTAYVTGISFSAGQGKQVLFKGKFRNGPDETNAFSVKFSVDLYQNSFFGTLVVPLMVPEMTDIAITGVTSLGGTVDATASYGMILVDN